MDIPLSTSRSRWLFLVGILLFAGTIIFAAARNWRAEHLAQSSKPDDWLRAALLEPGNAGHWYRLGRYYQLDLEHADLPRAISYYRRAVDIDPRSAFYWMDLASAYEMAGENNQAQEALEAAKAAYPISSEVAWRYGNFLLRMDRLPEAFAEIRPAVETDPKLAGPAISRCLQAGVDVQRILNEVIPRRVDAYLEALGYLVGERNTDAALAAWKRVVELRPNLALSRVFPLLDVLSEQDRTDEARIAWQQALELAGLVNRTPLGDSLIWDGGFERESLNGGFGWRLSPLRGASFEYDSQTFHSGSRSLRVCFDGTENLDFSHLVQYVPVKPATRYRFAAYVRTEEISTDSGIRFSIWDPHHEADLSVYTSNTVGSHPWTVHEIEFTTGPKTHLINVALRRTPSRKFDNKIRGKIWVDDVSLVVVLSTSTRNPV